MFLFRASELVLLLRAEQDPRQNKPNPLTQIHMNCTFALRRPDASGLMALGVPGVKVLLPSEFPIAPRFRHGDSLTGQNGSLCNAIFGDSSPSSQVQHMDYFRWPPVKAEISLADKGLYTESYDFASTDV